MGNSNVLNMQTTTPKTRRKRYRVLLPHGEYQMGATRWKQAVEGKLLVKLSDGLAEVAADVSVVFEGGEFCLRRTVTPSEWVLTNWVLIRRKNPFVMEAK